MNTLRFITGFVLLGLTAGLARGGDADVPLWRVAEADLRVRATRDGQSRYARVRLPAFTSGQKPVSALRAWVGDTERELRLAWHDDTLLDVWVDLVDETEGLEFAVYGIAGETPLALDDPLFTVRHPVGATVWRLGGQDSASDWDRMRWMWHQAGDPVTRFHLPTFMHVDGSRDEPPRWVQQRERARTQYLAHLSARLRLMEDRRGRFCLQTTQPTVLLLDGTKTASWPADSVRAGWALGDSMLLTDGLRRIEVFQGCEQLLSLRVAIWWEGEEAPMALTSEHLMLDLMPSPGIVEAIDEILHPMMTVDPLPAYRFVGADTVFRPMTLKDASVSRLGAVADIRWGPESAEWGQGESLFRIFTQDGPIRINAVVMDSLGFRRSHARTIEDDRLPVEEYRLTSAWRGLPAAAWPDDRVRPQLWAQTTAPDDLPLEVEFRQTSHFGDTRVWTAPLSFTEGVGWIPLPEISVDAVTHLEAVVRHAGMDLSRHAVRFVHPPFVELPDSVSGDVLLKGTTQWVLVPRYRARLGMPTLPVVKERRLVWIEDAVVDSNPAAAERARTDFALALKARLSPAAFDSTPLEDATVDRTGAMGVRALTTLARFAAWDVAVIALGEDAARIGTPPERFERQLSAVTGLLCEALNLDVVLATPLASGHPDALRPYAEAVHRVADAYALPVLDRYSFLLLQPDANRLLAGARLTPPGIARLSEWIASRFASNLPADSVGPDSHAAKTP